MPEKHGCPNQTLSLSIKLNYIPSQRPEPTLLTTNEFFSRVGTPAQKRLGHGFLYAMTTVVLIFYSIVLPPNYTPQPKRHGVFFRTEDKRLVYI
jgi:hypothetical protein